MLAARRVYLRAVDEGARRIAADDLALLAARVHASDPRLIVSTAASEQLDRAIDLLRAKTFRGAAGDELLIDALLTRQTLQLIYGLPEHLPGERRFEAGREAEAVALSRFGAGSRQHLRALAAFSRWRANTEGLPAARQLLDDAVRMARERGGDVAGSAELRAAEATLAAFRCQEGSDAAGSIAALRAATDQIRQAHGSASIELETQYLALGRCQRAVRDPLAALAADMAAYEVAAAREQPPSTQLMKRALDAFEAAMQARQLPLAVRLHEQVMANTAALPESALRERLTRVARTGQLCLLAEAGDYEAAMRVAAPLVADSDAVYAKVRRLTPRQGDLWTCLSRAHREQGRHDEALTTLATFIERCATTRLSPQIALSCRGDALIERALVELDTGRIADANATLAERLAMSPETAEHRTYALAHGRVLLASGQVAKSIDPLRRHHDEWAKLAPESPYTAVALYWLGRAHLAAGEARGRAMVDEARPVLAQSPVASHRRLAAELPQR
jgi:tetratricopeptide (TPR) repeat protein